MSTKVEFKTGGDFEILPTGEYPIQVTDVNLVDNKFQEGKKQVEFDLEVIGGDYDGSKMKAWAGLSGNLGGKAKLPKWSSALLGKSLEDGSSMDLEDLVGCRAVAVVLKKTKDDGKEFNKVDEIIPKKAKKGAAPAKRSEEDPFEEE